MISSERCQVSVPLGFNPVSKFENVRRLKRKRISLKVICCWESEGCGRIWDIFFSTDFIQKLEFQKGTSPRKKGGGWLQRFRNMSQSVAELYGYFFFTFFWIRSGFFLKSLESNLQCWDHALHSVWLCLPVPWVGKPPGIPESLPKVGWFKLIEDDKSTLA